MLNRLILVGVYAAFQFAGTGRPSVFAGRRLIQALRRLKRGSCQWLLRSRDRIAERLIQFAARFRPLPEAIPPYVSPTPCASDLPQLQRVAAPAVEPFPAHLWADIEADEPARVVTAPQKRSRAKPLVMGSAARVTGQKTKGRAAALQRESLYERAFLLMQAGKSLRAAAQEAGVPASSLRGWLKRR